MSDTGAKATDDVMWRDEREPKLPGWVRATLRALREEVARLRTKVGETPIVAPWLWTMQTSDASFVPLAGDDDFLIHYGEDPADTGAPGLRITPPNRRQGDVRWLDVTAVNGSILVQPVAGNHVRIVVVPDAPMHETRLP